MRDKISMDASQCATFVLVALLLLTPLQTTANEGERGELTPPRPAQSLSCFLRAQADPSRPCTAQEENLLPDRLSELMEGPECPEEFTLAANNNDLSTVPPARMAEVPLPLLFLLPVNHLSSCDPRALSAIVKKHRTNEAIARKVLSTLDSLDNPKRIRFIRELGFDSELSHEVEAVIGEAAVRWWDRELQSEAAGDEDDVSKVLASAGSPLLAALPPGYLAELPPEGASHLLFRLRHFHWREKNDPSWSSQPPATKRVWMELFKSDEKSGRAQLITEQSDGLNMLWAGATPDEIVDLQADGMDKKSLIKLRQLTKLQVRSLLATLYKTGWLSSTDLNDLFDWVLDLSPALLQRFSVNSTDFSMLPAASSSHASVPTMKQVLEFVVASGMVQNRIFNAKDPGSWGRNIKDIGRLVHLIRATLLRKFSQNSLPKDVLFALDSYDISDMQARYLTNSGNFVDFRLPLADFQQFHGLLRAIPTKLLIGLRSSFAQEGVLLHLLESLPAAHGARSASMLNKLRPQMRNPKVIEAMMRNPDPSQYFNLVSARELASERAGLEEAFNSIKFPKQRSSFWLGDMIDAHLNKKDDIDASLRFVPVSALSAILGSARRELSAKLRGSSRSPWTWSSLLNASRPLVRGSLAGLTCSDVLGVELVDLPSILFAYHQRRRESGMVFPKKLQHCMQRAMEDYLDMKQRVSQSFPREGLISLLEPSDITAFGGYVLSTLTVEHIRESTHANLILSTIGSLLPHELLAAVPGPDRLELLTSLHIRVLNARSSVSIRDLLALGNLHAFLPAHVISSIEPTAWKLFLESHAGDPLSLLVCASAQQRDAWHRLTVAAFGSPESWSAGVLGAIGDLLAAVPAEALNAVRQAAWRDAADTLAERTAYHLPVEVPGSDDTKPYVEACASLLPVSEQSAYTLGVRRMVRRYLHASQALLDTVVPADNLLRKLNTRSFREPAVFRTVNYSPHHLPPALSTSTTESTTTTEAATTSHFATFSTPEEPSSTFVDWESFFSSQASWLTVPTTVVYPTSTVIIHDDHTARTTLAADETSTPASIITTTDATKMTDEPFETGDMSLNPWPEAAEKYGLQHVSPRAAIPSSTARLEDYGNLGPSALSLPQLTMNGVAMYPSKGDTAAGGVKLSKTTVMYSADVMSTPSPAENIVVKRSIRRRRDLGDSDDDRELAEDVHLQVTCDAVRALGVAAWLALIPSDAEHMLDAEMEDCIDAFAKIPVNEGFARALWDSISEEKRHSAVGDLGNLLRAMNEDEAAELNLNLENEGSLDALSAIGEYVTDASVLRAVADRFADQNPSDEMAASVDPDSLLVALGPLTCAMPLDKQRMLLAPRGSLQHASHSLNRITRVDPELSECNITCLQELARAAVTDAALGPTTNWTAEDVHDMGAIVAGLSIDQLEKLTRPLNQVEQPISGLTASAISCMLPEQLKVIGDSLSMLSPVAASAVTDAQRHALNAGQEILVLRARNLAFTRLIGRQEPGLHEFSSSTATPLLNLPLLAVLCILHFCLC